MAVFSTNQTRHLYVAKQVVTSTPTKVGDIQVVSTEGAPYIAYMGADGTLMRSDILTNVESIRVASFKDMAKELQATSVTLKGEAVVGQHYVLKVTFKNFIGASDEYTLTVVADHLATTTDANDVYKALAVALAKNLSKHVTPLATVALEGDKATPVSASSKVEDLTGNYTGIIIQAAKQPWILGTKSADMVNFDVAFAPITVNGVDVVWGNTESLAPAEDGTGLVNNGETIADMEYFYMKERADQYGNIGWPNVVHTEYLVDPKKTYNTIDIHYAYVGSNEAIQKSEKDITIVVESSVANVKTNLITPLTTATKVTAKFTTAANTDVK